MHVPSLWPKECVHLMLPLDLSLLVLLLYLLLSVQLGTTAGGQVLPLDLHLLLPARFMLPILPVSFAAPGADFSFLDLH